MVRKLGRALKHSSISTGWWVGPSSPKPIESCVMMNVTPNRLRADTLGKGVVGE